MWIRCRVCYRQVVAYRYVLISLLAITLVVLISWTDEDYKNTLDIHPDIPSIKQLNYVRHEALHPPKNELHTRHQPDEEDRAEDSPKRCPKPDHRHPSQILLVTYGRSGSSLTADILQHHPDIYFHYEPLHNLAKTFSRLQGEFRMAYNKHLYLTQIPDYNKVAQRVIELLLTCNFTHLPPPAYNNLHLIRSMNTRPIRGCIRRAKNNETLIQSCLSLHSKICQLKPIQFIKTIRLATASVGPLMARLPNLKMIYLLRDPRGSYLSKLRAFPGAFSKNATYEALRICPRYKKDIEAALSFYRQYPDRVHITRYESIAEDPLGMSRGLYDFLCLELSPSIQEFIINNNMAGTNKTDKNIYGVNRQNSTAASYAWRSKIPLDQAKAFDEACQDFYTKGGYVPVDREEELRDWNFSLKRHVHAVS